MTIQECYQKLGGDYAEVRSRLMNDKLIRKFLGKFPNDDSFHNLYSGIRNGSREESFRAAHTLKGICQNLGLGSLLVSSGKMTEILRQESSEIPAEAMELISEVRRDYENTVSTILAYLEENQD